jgi:hypothetical protein
VAYPTNVIHRDSTLLALIGHPLRCLNLDCGEGQEGESKLNDQPDEAFGVKDKLVSGCLPVTHERV